jgi:hypothetical protein
MNQLTGEGYGRSAGILAGYALLVGVFHALFAGFLVAAGRRDTKLPGRIPILDLLMLGTATYKISRVLAKDSVTSFIRAPFTIYRGPAGASEVKEDVRGTGIRKSVGELITCPFCVGTWIAALLTYGLVLESRLARVIALMFTVATVSDALMYGFEALRKLAEESEPQKPESQDQFAAGSKTQA